MIYLVSKNVKLFESELYKTIPFKEALDILEPLKEVQCDSETSGLDCFTKEFLTLQLGNTDNQIVFDWTSMEPEDKLAIKNYMESDRLFIFHNAMFDLQWLYMLDIWPKNIYDTMVAEQVLYLGLPARITIQEYDDYKPTMYEDMGGYYNLSYSLKATAKRHLGIDIDKSVRGDIITKGLTEAVVQYSGLDVKYLQDIKESQLKQAEKDGLVKAIKFECAFIKPLAYNKFCGVKLDADRWKEKMRKDQDRLAKAKKSLDDYVIQLKPLHEETTDITRIRELEALGYKRVSYNAFELDIASNYTFINRQGDLFSGFNLEPQCSINWNSPQVIPLFEALGINCNTFDKKTKKKKKSIEEKILAPQAKDFPIIPMFLEYQGAAKVCSTYGDNYLKAINPVTGRLHPELHSLGTNTGRISSGGGPYKVNILNLPRDAETRACFVASKGNSWLSSDYTGQESAITASTTNDSKMVSILNNGGDMHSEVARACWPDKLGKLTDKEIKARYKDLRQSAKGVE